MKKLSKVLAVLLAAILCMGIFTVTGAYETKAEEVYEFDVSLATPEPISQAFIDTFARLEEASEGRLQFTIYYSWSLSSVSTIVDDFNSGIVDIGVLPLNEHTNLFPYSNLVTDTPFMGIPSMEANGIIYDELYNEYDVFKAEYDRCGLHYWTNFANAPYHLFTVGDTAILNPEELKGVKVITDDAMLQQFISNNGGAPVSTPVTEYATSLNTNVVDGAINHAATFSAFGCLDFIHSATIFGEEGIMTSLGSICFSQEAWDSLPEDLQQLFNEEATNLRDAYTAEVRGMADGAIAALKDSGANVVELSDEEIDTWSASFDEILANKIATLESQGATEAQTYYDIVQEKIAAYK